MEEDLPTEYDVIVVGTGLVECVVAAAAARIGKKVLHIDKNDYYGVQWASFNLKGFQEWVKEVTARPTHTRTIDECELGEGEQLVATRDPSQDYSKVTQTWHVPEEPLPSPSPEPSAAEHLGCGGGDPAQNAQPDIPQDTANGTLQDTTESTPADTPNNVIEAPPTTAAEAAPQNTTNSTAQDPPQEMQHGTANGTLQDTPEDSTPRQGASMEEEQGEEARRRWSQQELFELNRKFNLDLAPKLLYSQGPMVELLISSNIARYVEFKCITRILTWLRLGGARAGAGTGTGGLVVVPCSRSDVFTTSTVSLVEKRLLMKFLDFCHQYHRHPEQLQDYLNKPFVDFLRSRKLTDNLIHFVTEAIGMVEEGVACREGLERTRAFLTSLGRYGTTPFLFSMYGSGELPQAFCRLCAVFEGIYILRKPVSSLVLHAPSNTCRGLVSEGQRFTCSHLVMSVSGAPQEYLPQNAPSRCVSRGLFITDRSILPHEREQLTLLRLPAKEGNPVPVTVLEVGSGTHVCPKGLYCLHMTCCGHDSQSDLQVAVERLLDPQHDSGRPTPLWSLYFNHVDYSECDLQSQAPANLYMCPGPSADLDYDSAIDQARNIFSRMFPGEEFLPRAPDPDEIAFDNCGTEPKQGDTFGAEEDSKDDEKQEKGVEKQSEGGEGQGEGGEGQGEGGEAQEVGAGKQSEGQDETGGGGV